MLESVNRYFLDASMPVTVYKARIMYGRCQNSFLISAVC